MKHYLRPRADAIMLNVDYLLYDNIPDFEQNIKCNNNIHPNDQTCGSSGYVCCKYINGININA